MLATWNSRVQAGRDLGEFGTSHAILAATTRNDLPELRETVQRLQRSGACCVRGGSE